MDTIALPRRRPAMHRGVARILHWLLQKLSAKAFFRQKVDDLSGRRLQNFTVLNKAGPTSKQSQFFRKKSTQSTVGGLAPLIPFWLRPWQRNAIRCSPLPYSDAVCVNAAAVSALLMTLPRTGGFLTVRLLPWDTQASKHASVLISKCCSPRCLPHPRRVRGPPTMIFASAGDVTPPSLVVPSVGTTNDGGGGG